MFDAGPAPAFSRAIIAESRLIPATERITNPLMQLSRGRKWNLGLTWPETSAKSVGFKRHKRNGTFPLNLF